MISRDLYKKIKKMNRNELNSYLSNLYSQGVQEGSKSNAVVTNVEEYYQKGYNHGLSDGVGTISSKIIDSIDNGLKNTPGIGQKRYELIMNNITDELVKNDVDIDTTNN